MKRIVQIGLLALVVVIGGITVANRRKALQLQEQERLARVQVVRQKILEKGVPSVFPKGASQTEGWLSQVGWLDVRVFLQLSLKETFDLLRMTYITIIPREKKLANDFFAFYHAQLREFWVFYELQKQLYEKLRGKKLDQFYFLRELGEFERDEKNVQEWLAQKPVKIIFDWEPHIATQLLSTNVAFPGNLELGESTAHYYLTSCSVSPPNLSTLFYSVIAPYFKAISLTNAQQATLAQCIQKLNDLAEDVRSDANKFGLLLSIFIPRYLVDSCAYMSGVGGGERPEGHYLAGASLPSEVLLALAHRPSELKNIKSIQARLRLDAAFFGDADSGIKMFINHGITNNNLKVYGKKLTAILDTIMEVFEGGADTFKSQDELNTLVNQYNTYVSAAWLKRFINIVLKAQEGWEDPKKAFSLAVLALHSSGNADAKLIALSIIAHLVEKESVGIANAISPIEKGMADSEYRVREKSADTILRLVKDGKIEIAQMILFIKRWASHSIPSVRGVALYIGTELVRGDFLEMAQIMPLIEKGVKDIDASVRDAAFDKVPMLVLWNKLTRAQARLLVEKGLADEDADVRMRAMGVIESLIENNKVDAAQVIPFIEKGMADEDARVRMSVLGVIKSLIENNKVDEVQVIPFNEKGLIDEDVYVKEQAKRIKEKYFSENNREN